MNETYVECLVKHKTSPIFKILKVVFIVLCVLCVLECSQYGILALILAVLAGLAAFYMGRLSSVEYEYLYLDKEINVDKIMNKSNRKRVASYSLEKMDIIAPYSSHRLDGHKARNLSVKNYGAADNDEENKDYAFVYENKLIVVFTPSEKMINAIKSAAPFKTYTD